MKLDGIETFVAVAEAGSLSEAARRLNLSKSVVSERLAELERSLGAALIHRTTRRLSLTDDGTAFLNHASRIVQDVAAAAAEIAERRGTLSGPLRISAPVTFGRMHLGPALYPFLRDHPAIALTVEFDDRRVEAAAEGFDAVIRHGAIVDSRAMVWRLAPSRRVLVASPDYLDRHGTPDSVDALAAHKGVFYANRGVADWRFVHPDGNLSVRAKIGLRVNNGDVMRDATIAGLGIALLPTFIASAAIKRGELAVIDIGLETEEEFIFIAHPEGRRPSAKLRALAEALRRAFGSPPYWEAW